MELVIAAVLMTGVAGAVFAQSASEHIEARKAFMKSVGSARAALRGTDIAAAKTGAETLVKGFHDFPGHFPAGSDATAGPTNARSPDVWTKMDAFKAEAAAAEAIAKKALDAANAGDIAGVNAAANDLGATCTSCHNSFRGAPKV